jgi:hypothetical protein
VELSVLETAMPDSKRISQQRLELVVQSVMMALRQEMALLSHLRLLAALLELSRTLESLMRQALEICFGMVQFLLKRL